MGHVDWYDINFSELRLYEKYEREWWENDLTILEARKLKDDTIFWIYFSVFENNLKIALTLKWSFAWVHKHRRYKINQRVDGRWRKLTQIAQDTRTGEVTKFGLTLTNRDMLTSSRNISPNQ